MSADITVTRNDELGRFEATVDGELAGYAEFQSGEGHIVFTHTEVDDAVEGRGVGSALVRGALDAARDRNTAVRPDCPFVRAYIARHDEYLDLVPVELRERLGL